MSTLSIQRSVQFQKGLFEQNDRTAWYEAVGNELASRGVSITVGEGANARQVTDAVTLKAAMAELEQRATGSNQSLRNYIIDLVQAIDDVVRPGSTTATSDSFDFSIGKPLAQALGLDDNKRLNYAASSTPFGRRDQASVFQVDGVTLEMTASADRIDLSEVPHMSAETLRGAPVTSGRAGEEVEDTRVITGLTTGETVALARRALNQLQRPDAVVGFTVGLLPLDEMKWDGDAHALRRANPYVSFTLDDSRSYQRFDPGSGEPRVGIGRDFFFDIFMAKKDLRTGRLTKDLQRAELMVRGRIRYNSTVEPTDPSRVDARVLSGMKLGTAVDPDGTKHAIKVDSRVDNPPQATLDGLVEAVQTGLLGEGWSWSGSNISPASVAAYRAAVQRGITDDLGGESDVLAMAPGAVARQIRGRFHLNETRRDALRTSFVETSGPRLQELVDLIGAAAPWQARDGLPSKTDLLAQGQGLLDRSAIVRRVHDAIAEQIRSAQAAGTPVSQELSSLVVDDALVQRLWPTNEAATPFDAKLKRVVADAIRSEFDAFAEAVDELQREIGGTTDRSVREAGSAGDVADYFRHKGAVAKAKASFTSTRTPAEFMGLLRAVLAKPTAERDADLMAMGITLDQANAIDEAALSTTATPEAQAVKGFFGPRRSPAEFMAVVEALLAKPEDEREAQLERIGIGEDQLDDFTAADFASTVELPGNLFSQQTFTQVLKQFDAQLAGPNADAFAAELGAWLADENRPALSQASAVDRPAVLANLRKNLVTAHTEVLHRMVEAAGAWGQALWFKDYRSTMLNIDPGSWNFLIASFDYSEFYDAEVGQALSFRERVSRQPLDEGRMTGAMLSNDIQIELDSESGYTNAIRNAQAQLNGAAARRLVDFAAARQLAEVTVGNADSVERWVAAQAAKTGAELKAFVDDVNAFNKDAGSPIELGAMLTAIKAQLGLSSLLVEFALKREPTLASQDRAAITAWYNRTLTGSQDAQGVLLTQLAAFAAEKGSTENITVETIQGTDLSAFGQPAGTVGAETDDILVERLAVAHEVWSMMKASQRDLSLARGREVQEVLEDNGLRGKGWEPPLKPKGDYAIDAALPS